MTAPFLIEGVSGAPSTIEASASSGTKNLRAMLRAGDRCHGFLRFVQNRGGSEGHRKLPGGSGTALFVA